MRNTGLRLKLLDSTEDARVCAKMMAHSDPWVRLKRGYKESLKIIIKPSTEVYVMWLREEIVGFIIVEMVGTFKGYIKSVCVSPENRGKGIGSLLMKHAEERIFLEASNVFLLVSSFNTKARKLYMSLGYEEIGEIHDFIVRGYSEILMRKTIGPLTEFRTD